MISAYIINSGEEAEPNALQTQEDALSKEATYGKSDQAEGRTTV
jgi:hypothetical protein